MAEEATVNADGTTTFEDTTPPVNETAGEEGEFEEAPPMDEETTAEVVKGTDPAIYLLIAVVLIAAFYYFFVYRKKKAEENDPFFSNLDVEKFDLKLPDEVDEYYKVKAKCEAAGWEPGQTPPPGQQQNASGPHRVLAQALMKRAMADIPIVQHIQKESAGMNRLYAQSMVSVTQWRAYQAAEALVSAEVDEVRAEADEIDPGWSNAIWRQAMQYHNMLKQKHEQEAKAIEEEAKKRKEIEKKVAAAKKQMAEKSKEEDVKAKELAAEKAAQELLKMEEREKQSKKSFQGGMKKGFLDSKSSKKK